MIAARLPALAVHALLHHRPVAVVGDDETVQVEIEAVLHGGAVDLGHETAGLRELAAVEADVVADRDEFARRLARMFPAPAADVDAELVLQRRQPALERADDAGRDAGGMPVHPHDGAEGLKPERIGQPAQKLVAAVVVHDGLGHHRAQPGHAVRQPFRHLSAVQRQISTARPSRHQSHIPRKRRVPDESSVHCLRSDSHPSALARGKRASCSRDARSRIAVPRHNFYQRHFMYRHKPPSGHYKPRTLPRLSRAHLDG